MASNVDADQTAPLRGLIWDYTVSQAQLSEYGFIVSGEISAYLVKIKVVSV